MCIFLFLFIMLWAICLMWGNHVHLCFHITKHLLPCHHFHVCMCRHYYVSIYTTTMSQCILSTVFAQNVTSQHLSIAICFQCTLTVTDQGYPSENVISTNVTILTIAEPSPSFASLTYSALTDENKVVGSVVTTVDASKSGLMVRKM